MSAIALDPRTALIGIKPFKMGFSPNGARYKEIYPELIKFSEKIIKEKVEDY